MKKEKIKPSKKKILTASPHTFLSESLTAAAFFWAVTSLQSAELVPQ